LGVPGAKSGWVGSFHGACRHDPLAALAGRRRDQVKVGVVVEDSDAEFLGGGCDREVGDLAASLTALSEEALDLKCPALVRRGGIDKFKRVERTGSFHVGDEEDMFVQSVKSWP
jgi:hypothetical protein